MDLENRLRYIEDEKSRVMLQLNDREEELEQLKEKSTQNELTFNQRITELTFKYQ